MDRLLRFSGLRVQQTPVSYIRYLYREIDWSNRLISIQGARGTGKTTLILQRMKQQHPDPETALYLSLDDPWFLEHNLIDLLEDFVNQGGRYAYLDEVHKYRNWSTAVKTLYDTFPDLYIVFTGSSILQLRQGDADLSRRAVRYRLQGLSFREYLNVTQQLSLPSYTLKEILQNHVAIARDITRQTKVLKAFRHYLSHGYYPFFLEDPESYHIKLTGSVMQVLESDLMPLEHLKADSLEKLKRFLTIIAEMVPFKPNITELSTKIGISRPMLYQFLDLLQNSDMIHLVYRDSKGMKKMEKPDKLYLHNTNLAFGLAGSAPEKGMLRETFFINQLQPRHIARYGEPFDFLVDDRHAVEIGGKNKKPEQLKDRKNAFLAIDDIETGYRNRIPLWLFGFLY